MGIWFLYRALSEAMSMFWKKQILANAADLVTSLESETLI